MSTVLPSPVLVMTVTCFSAARMRPANSWQGGYSSTSSSRLRCVCDERGGVEGDRGGGFECGGREGTAQHVVLTLALCVCVGGGGCQ